jgi:hypothetical protein
MLVLMMTMKFDVDDEKMLFNAVDEYDIARR